MIKKIIKNLFSSHENTLPDGHEWCFVCGGGGTDDGICDCMACDGYGYIEKSKVSTVKNKLFGSE